MNKELGSHQGSRHETPNLWNDIQVLMDLLQEQAVYKLESGRTVPGEKAVVPNIAAVGFNALYDPLSEFNANIRKLQSRMHVTPVPTKAAAANDLASDSMARPTAGHTSPAEYGHVSSPVAGSGHSSRSMRPQA